MKQKDNDNDNGNDNGNDNLFNFKTIQLMS